MKLAVGTEKVTSMSMEPLNVGESGSASSAAYFNGRTPSGNRNVGGPAAIAADASNIDASNIGGTSYTIRRLPLKQPDAAFQRIGIFTEFAPSSFRSFALPPPRTTYSFPARL